MKKTLLTLLFLMSSCSHTPGDSSSSVSDTSKTFLESVAGKSLYDPADAQKTGTFSADGKINRTEYGDTYVWQKSVSDNRAVYSRTESGHIYFLAFEYNGENSRYWQTEDFTGHVNDIIIK